MKFIAHRGNLQGPNPARENHPDYILEAIQQGYEVEVDLWYTNNSLYLGHDCPEYQIDKKYLNTLASANFLWTHAKNIEAFEYLSCFKNLYFTRSWNFFWHHNDDYTLTSLHNIWAYPGKKLSKNSICVLPETSKYDILDLSTCKGICTDYVYKYERMLNE